VIKDQHLVCDSCQKTITRLTTVPEEGWAQMHNLCSDCFRTLGQQAIARG